MALSVEMKERLAQMDIPSDAIVRERLERWMAATGWGDPEVASAIQKENGDPYSRIAINHFRYGRYPDAGKADGTRAIRAELVRLMDEHPVITQRRARGKTYDTESYRKIRKAFFGAVDNGWAYCVDGAPGSQKTHILQALADELEQIDADKNGSGRRVLYVRCRPKMSRRDMLVEIAMAAGIIARGPIGPMMRRIRHRFAGRRVLLILDEGQHLHTICLETVRELLDEPPYFGLLFAGSHDLQTKFMQLEMEQWRSRLQRVITLEGLTEDEVREIATDELGACSDKRLRELVEYCRVPDYRQRGKTYLSARQLFHFIQQVRAETAPQMEVASA